MVTMAGAEIRPLSRVIALVTGGASGLGRATAARLAKQVRLCVCVCVYVCVYVCVCCVCVCVCVCVVCVCCVCVCVTVWPSG